MHQASEPKVITNTTDSNLDSSKVDGAPLNSADLGVAGLRDIAKRQANLSVAGVRNPWTDINRQLTSVRSPFADIAKRQANLGVAGLRDIAKRQANLSVAGVRNPWTDIINRQLISARSPWADIINRQANLDVEPRQLLADIYHPFAWQNRHCRNSPRKYSSTRNFLLKM